MAHEFSCPAGMWTLPGPGIEPVSLALQADSLPLDHQGSPAACFLVSLFPLLAAKVKCDCISIAPFLKDYNKNIAFVCVKHELFEFIDDKPCYVYLYSKEPNCHSSLFHVKEKLYYRTLFHCFSRVRLCVTP